VRFIVFSLFFPLCGKDSAARASARRLHYPAASMSWFWIIGIVANVTLTVLAIVWVVRQGRPRSDVGAAAEAADPQDGQGCGDTTARTES
jgi:formate-dependent nitrite reductase membrane component NrfD